MMMTQEKTNAYADEKQQQAWYAAEAGFKRAAVLLGQTSANWSDDWSWTTYNASDFNSNDRNRLRKIDLKTLATISDSKDSKDQPWYAVNVAQITEGTFSYPTATKTYDVTSIGEYMGERKIIKRQVTITITNTPTPSTDTVNPTQLITMNSLLSGGSVDLSKMYSPIKDNNGVSTNDNNANMNKLIYTNNLTNSAGAYMASVYAKYVIGTAPADYAAWLTKVATIPDSYFLDKATVISQGAQHIVMDSSGSNLVSPATITPGSTYYVDSTSLPSWGSYYVPSAAVAEALAGSTIYMYDDTWTKWHGSFNGPTAASAVPLTVVINNTSAVTLGFNANKLNNANTYGKVRVLTASDVTFSGYEKLGYFMAMSNGSMTLSGQKVTCGFVSAVNNLTITGGAFTGQAIAGGTLAIGGADFTLDSTVLSNKNFWLSSWSE